MGHEEADAGIPLLPFEYCVANCLEYCAVGGGQDEAMISITWNSGTIHVQCVGFHPSSRSVVKGVERAIWRFVTECQLMFVLYKGVLRSRGSIKKELSKDLDRDTPLVFADRDEVGTIRDVWAQVSLGKVLDAFSRGGEYESIYAKSFVIFVYQLWEDFIRPGIARHLGVDHKTVKSDLMGEWRHLRNWLIHPSDDSEQAYFDNADRLAKIPDQPQRGTAVVSSKMVEPMMGYLNSLHIILNPNGLTPLVGIDLMSSEETEQISRLLASDRFLALLHRQFKPPEGK